MTNHPYPNVWVKNGCALQPTDVETARELDDQTLARIYRNIQAAGGFATDVSAAIQERVPALLWLGEAIKEAQAAEAQENGTVGLLRTEHSAAVRAIKRRRDGLFERWLTENEHDAEER